MEKIIGLGNALVDVLARLDSDKTLQDINLPKGSMQLIDTKRYEQINGYLQRMETQTATGGSAGNAIKALANLGIQAGFIGKIGNDRTAEFYLQCCSEQGIQARLAKSEQASGVACTFISPDGERTFGTYLGAAATLQADDLLSEMFRGYTYLFIEGYLVQNHALIRRAIELAKLEGLQICLDLASYNIVEQDHDFFMELVTNYVDILFANEEEARAFTGLSPEASLTPLSKLCTIAVVKLGSKGSLIQKGEDTYRIAPYPVEQAIDTTGAGDYYAAGFLYGLIGGNSIPKCGAIGSLLAGYVIGIVGATLPKAKWDEIKLKIQAIITR